MSNDYFEKGPAPKYDDLKRLSKESKLFGKTTRRKRNIPKFRTTMNSSERISYDVDDLTEEARDKVQALQDEIEGEYMTDKLKEQLKSQVLKTALNSKRNL